MAPRGGKKLKYNHDYKQSFTQKMYEADIVIAVDYKSKVEVLKSRYSYAKEELSLEETIDILAIILSRKLFGNCLDMFREGFKIEVKKAIKQTIEGGVAKCEPHSTNELLEWDSNVKKIKGCTDIQINMEKLFIDN